LILVVGGWLYLAQSESSTAGQGEGAQAVLGTPGPELPVTGIGSLTKDNAGKVVRIEGTITEECPHSGCWAYVQDDSGKIRIDTNKGGFALPLHKEGSKVTVTGEVTTKENGDLELQATSAQL